MAKVIKVQDNTEVGFHYESTNGTYTIVKNKYASWVVRKNGEIVETWGIAQNAINAVEEMA